MQIINGYILDSELVNENSGFSKWGFCEKDNKAFFIKEFLSPIYPTDASFFSPAQTKRMLTECKEFEKRLTDTYTMINRVSDGNLVRIHEFFRFNSKYYITTEIVGSSGLTPEEIALLPYSAKKLICKIVTHAILKLHNEGFVHADIKPNNVLITADNISKKYSAKIIDFDCGFFGTEPPRY